MPEHDDGYMVMPEYGDGLYHEGLYDEGRYDEGPSGRACSHTPRLVAVRSRGSITLGYRRASASPPSASI